MAPTTRETVALVKQFLTDVIAAGDTDALDHLLADDVVSHQPVLNVGDGWNAERQMFWRVLSAADIDITIDDVVASGDQVALRGTVTGTHTESLLDVAPTGASFEIDCVWFARTDDGRISEIWSLPDGLALIRQLGVNPERNSDRTPAGLTGDQ